MARFFRLDTVNLLILLVRLNTCIHSVCSAFFFVVVVSDQCVVEFVFPLNQNHDVFLVFVLFSCSLGCLLSGSNSWSGIAWTQSSWHPCVPSTLHCSSADREMYILRDHFWLCTCHWWEQTFWWWSCTWPLHDLCYSYSNRCCKQSPHRLQRVVLATSNEDDNHPTPSMLLWQAFFALFRLEWQIGRPLLIGAALHNLAEWSILWFK